MTSLTDAASEAQPVSQQRPPRVVYVSSAQGRSYADRLPSNIGRSSIVHALIQSLDLVEDDTTNDNDDDESISTSQSTLGKEDKPSNRARAVEPIPAGRSDLSRFHDRDYIDALFKASKDPQSPETSFDVEDEPSPRKRMRHDLPQDNYSIEQSKDRDSYTRAEEPEGHGLEHDCPVFTGLEDYCCYVAGGSITAARELRRGNADIAIFWDGGRHHATKSAAAGYCYINDVVLAILELQKNPLFDKVSVHSKRSSSLAPKRLKKILYVDLDLHHGDGVAEAFETNPNVVTVSLHLWSKGFYPSTPKGHLNYSGPATPSPAANTSLNIAVPKSGLSDTNFNLLVNECIKLVFEAVKPDALVLQCGVDGLAGDPCREFNISLKGYGRAVQSILSWCRTSSYAMEDDTGQFKDEFSKDVPVLILGGGGYHSTNAARAWAYLTSIALDRPLDLNKGTIPDSCKYWDTFYNDTAAGEGLDIPGHLSRRDENDESDMREIVDKFESYAAALIVN